MKIKWPRLSDRAAVVAGLLLLLAAGAMALAGWGGGFSEWERRNLAPAPAAPNLADWRTDRETEAYLTDHVPLRQALVAVDSTAQLLTGRRTQLNAWPAGGAIVERPVACDAAALGRKLARLERAAGETPWVLLSPPTHGWLIRDRMTPPMAAVYAPEGEILAQLAENAHYVPMPEAFAADPDRMYCRTDHHWTLDGAYQAYLALAGRLGFDPAPLESFTLTEYPGFRGTTLSRSGLPALDADTLRCAAPAEPVTLTVRDADAEAGGVAEHVYDRLIFPEDAAGWDGYAVYLHGNHGWLAIDNPAAPEGTLVVFRDSFASSVLPMLAHHYRRVVAVDARYYSEGTFSAALSAEEDVRAVVYLYSLDSLANDTEITKKAR